MCCGTLGWDPQEFWSAQLWECHLAHDAYTRHEDELEAVRAARLINGMRNAFHADNFSQVQPQDYLRDGPTVEELEDARTEMSDTFPTTLDES